jgi:hypothetical protein
VHFSVQAERNQIASEGSQSIARAHQKTGKNRIFDADFADLVYLKTEFVKVFDSL